MHTNDIINIILIPLWIPPSLHMQHMSVGKTRETAMILIDSMVSEVEIQIYCLAVAL